MCDVQDSQANKQKTAPWIIYHLKPFCNLLLLRQQYFMFLLKIQDETRRYPSAF